MKHQASGASAMKLEIEAAYRTTRTRAQHTTTVRLRFAERSLRRRVHHLDGPERAQLAGMRDELRARGIDPHDLGTA